MARCMLVSGIPVTVASWLICFEITPGILKKGFYPIHLLYDWKHWQDWREILAKQWWIAGNENMQATLKKKNWVIPPLYWLSFSLSTYLPKVSGWLVIRFQSKNDSDEKKTVYDLICSNLRHVNMNDQCCRIAAITVNLFGTNARIIATSLNPEIG